MKTIRQSIDYVFEKLKYADVYFGHGTDNAWDEAVVLVLQVLALPFDVDEKTLQRELIQAEREKILNMLDKRIKTRKPLPYLTKQAYFVGLSFYVDERVIIPRSPIAELIENEFSPWIKPNDVHSILDLCTGSGCIAIACAKFFPNAHIDAVELSEDALAVAKINVEQHEVGNQVNLIQSDLFEQLANKKYDVIVSNPPYVSQNEMNELPCEYCHEPEMALLAKDNGLAVVEKILQQAPGYLTEHGILIVEVGSSRTALEERFPDIPFVWLEFSRGGEGVFLLGASMIVSLRDEFSDS